MISILGKKIIRVIRRAGIRCTAILLCILMVPVFWIPDASAASVSSNDIPTDEKNRSFTLVVGTGAVNGDAVSYFDICYTDTSNRERHHFVNPHNSSMSPAKKLINYTSAPYKYANDIMQFHTEYGLSSDNAYNAYDGLRENSVDTYNILLLKPCKTINSVKVVMRYVEGSKNAWTCNSFNLYENTSVYGIKNLAYISDKYYVDFDGELKAKFEFLQENGKEFVLGEHDEIFEIGDRKNTSKVYLKKSDFSVDEKTYISKEKNKKLIFRIDIADVYKATIRALYNDIAVKYKVNATAGSKEVYVSGYEKYDGPEPSDITVAQMKLLEAITIKFSYDDIYGNSRSVSIPFITSYLAWASENVNGFSSNSTVFGIGQQGDTMLFAGNFPGFKSIRSFGIYFGKEAIHAAYNFDEKYYDQTLDEIKSEVYRYVSEIPDPIILERYQRFKADDCSLNLTGISIFDGASTKVNASFDNGTLKMNTQGDPLYYFKATSASGIVISSGSYRDMKSELISVKPDGKKGVTLLPRQSENTYIVEIETDTLDTSDTTGDIFVKFNYMSTVTGVEENTATINVNEYVNDFIGYWPSTNNSSGKSISYLRGTQKGGILAFPIVIEDLAYFTSIDLTVDARSADDWQINRITIFHIAASPLREALWVRGGLDVPYCYYENNTKKSGTCTIDRLYSRNYSKDEVVQNLEKKILLSEQSSSITLEFDENGGDPIHTRDVNWNQIKDSMTFNEALQDLGFTKSRIKYQVSVDVYSNSNSDDTYGDCGSNNKFYFKLIFKDGSSGYVQANQQLSSDGFRAGMTETFYISVNRDYGDLIALRVIPDDVIEGSDIYDKLNVKSIEVAKIGSSAVSTTWIFDNVGWIDIDFQDDGAKGSVNGQSLRTEYEMSKYYTKTAEGYTANFMVALATGDFEAKYPYQLEGTMTATVSYRAKNGEIRDMTFDVAGLIAEYAGKTVLPDTNGGPDYSLGGKSKTLIDSTYMFVPGKTNRFYISLTDVEQIYSIKFNVTSTVATYWGIERVDIYQVLSDGILYINGNNEYQRDQQLQQICSNSNSGTQYIDLTYMDAGSDSTASRSKSKLIDLTDNKIVVNTESGAVDIERVPVGEDDTVNVYIYFDKSVDVANLASGSYKAALQYQKRDADTTTQILISNLKAVPEKNMLYGLGVNTKAMSKLLSLSLKTNDSAKVKNAIVQQVRAGVVIKTYSISFGLSNECMYGVTGTVYAPSAEEQILKLNFADSTRSTVIIPGNDEIEGTDIAVAISYTTTNDPQEVIYDSPYIYFSDQNIKEIAAGKTIDLVFNESYIKELKGIKIVSIGGVTATVKCGVLFAYSSDSSKSLTLTSKFNLANEMPVTRSISSYSCTDDNVTPVEITVSNGKLIEQFDSSKYTVDDFKMSMVLYVNDKYGEPYQISYDDITPYIIKGSFAPQSEAVISMLLADVSEIIQIEFCPHSNDTSKQTMWLPSCFTLKWTSELNEKIVTRPQNAVISEDNPYMLNTKNVSLSIHCEVHDPNDSTKGISKNGIQGNTLTFDLEDEEYLTFIPQIKNGIPTYSYIVEFDGEDDTSGVVLTSAKGEYTLSLPEGKTCKIKVSSEEEKSISIMLIVKS